MALVVPQSAAGSTLAFDPPSWESERTMRRIEREPLPDNVGQLVDEAAAAHGERPLACFFNDDVVVTYRELAKRTARLADGLARKGVRHGTHVAVMLETEASYLLTWLALLKLGAVVVPVNNAYTARELAYVIADSQAEFLIIHTAFAPLLDQNETSVIPSGQVVVVSGRRPGSVAWEDVEAAGSESFQPERRPFRDDPANIQYTSGTTGLPKGAVLPQAYWLLRGRVWRAQLRFPIRRNLIAQPFYYIDGQAMLMLALTGGGTAYVARRQSASRFMDWVRQYAVEFCSLPEVVTRAAESADDADNALKIAYCYSHQLANYARVEARYGCVARQGYGMTELGSALYWPVEAEKMVGTGTVGIPTAHRQVQIAAENGSEAARGEVGEIWVRGYATSLGYFNRPEANEAAWTPDGWFRTGDAGRQDEDGFFFYLGRRKDMVRRSGENISAVEVESVLRGVSGVLEAAVLPVPDDIRGEEVKAYVRLEAGLTPEDIPPASIVQHCRLNLARFKVPRYIEYVADFPRTPGLKIKKVELIAAKTDLRRGSYDAVADSWQE